MAARSLHTSRHRAELGRFAAALVVASSLVAFVASPITSSPQRDAQQETPTSGLITLYANDALASSLSLRTAGYGGRILEGEVALDQAQIAYDVFEPGQLSIGFASDENVNAVDLGPSMVVPQSLATDVSLKFPISVFHTLGLEARRLVFTEPGGSGATLRHGQKIFGVIPTGLRSFEPEIGHCIVLRYQRTRGDRGDFLAKLLVVDHRPGESVTLRWQQMGKL